MYRLSNWTILYCRTRLGETVIRLRGEVFDHPRYAAGVEVTISTLTAYRLEGNELSVITRTGSEYVLGKPHPDELEPVNRVLRQLNAQRAEPPPDSSSPEGTET